MCPLFGRHNFVEWLFELHQFFKRIDLKETLSFNPTNERKRNMAMDIIRAMIASSELPLIEGCIFPRQAIRTLARHYFPATIRNHAQIRHEIETSRQVGIGVQKFINKILSLYKQLQLSGVNVSQQEIMATIFYKLPAEFEPMKNQLEFSTNLKVFIETITNFDHELAWQRAIDEQRRRRQQQRMLF